MPYIANKKMNLAGKVYAKGDVISERVFSAIDPARQGALTRTRLIIEVESVPKPPGDMCPHCDEGPFQRLAQHVSLKHEDILLAEEDPAPADDSGETNPPEEDI